MRKIKTIPKLIRVALIALLAVFLAVFFRNMSVQDNPKNTIRVLIDRYPRSQALDVTARKIQPLIDEFQYEKVEFQDEEKVVLTHPTRPTLEFIVVKDEGTRALKLSRGDAEVLYDSLSLAKTEWVRKQKSELKVISTSGYSLTYLGFQLHHGSLKNVMVRRAIAHALPVGEWIQYKLFNWVEPANQLKDFNFDIALAKKLLDEAGYPDNGQDRLTVRYFTTPVREGYDTGILVREALKKIGINVAVTSLEPSLYFSKLKSGDFDLFSTRWIRNSPLDPINELIGPAAKRNYLNFQSPELDRILLRNPAATFDDITKLIETDLPFLPLYNWKHGLIVNSRVRAPANINESMDETFRFLARLELVDALK